MSNKRILTVQDISCVGQCSLTVALPILSSCGIEAGILPSAVLSTHTGGFTNYTFRDLTKDMPSIIEHWKSENIKFDALYTGYLGNSEQIESIRAICDELLENNSKVIVDPAMADNGSLYPGFDSAYVEEMKSLAFAADIIIPNITEAALLADYQYKENYDEEYIRNLIHTLHERGAETVILTGVGYEAKDSGVVVSQNGDMKHYRHEKISEGWHGTGDVYASSFVGAYLNGKTVYEAAVIAADYTLECIKNTMSDPSHWYGVKFEALIPKLIDKLK